jgi:ketosteroid isomerase-like protein
VRELADRRAIEDAVIAYGHALDSRDYARLERLFKPDARIRYGGSSWLDGVAEAARFCARALDPLDASQHLIGSIAVELEGDRASSRAYVCAEHLKGGARFTVGGTYVDAWERTPAGWRIAQRELVMTWTDGDPSVVAPPRSAR